MSFSPELSKYKTKSVEVEAVHFTHEHQNYLIARWCGGFATMKTTGEIAILVRTPEGEMAAEVDDWIVKEPDGFRVYKPDKLAEAYDPA